MGDQPWIPGDRQVSFLDPPVNPNEYDLNSGIVKVNDRFQSYDLLALIISRFALYGCLRQDYAQLRTLRPIEA
jgi:hypothetical protein